MTQIKNNLLLSGHSAEILSVSYDNHTNYLASAGIDRSIFIWSHKNSYDNIAVLKGHSNAITSLTWTYQDRLLSASADKTMTAWDVQQQKHIRKYKGHNLIIHDVAAPKKTKEIYATVSDDGTLKIWQPRMRQQVKNYQGKYPLTSVCFNLNGDKLYAGGIESEILVYNLAQNKLQQKISGHQDIVSNLQLSFDGTYLMSSSFDQTIRIWDIRGSVSQSKRLKKTLTGHVQGNQKNLIRGGWSIDGLYICSGSADQCAYIWDTTTRKIVQRLGGHIGTVNQVVMGKQNWMASCSNDKNIIVSQLPEIFL